MKKTDLNTVLSGLDEDLILEAIPPAWLSGAAPVKQRRRRDEESAFSRFMSSGVAAAVLSAIVSIAVLMGVVALGQSDPVTPGGQPGELLSAETEKTLETIATPVTDTATDMLSQSFRKLHFYVDGNPDYATIDSLQELTAAASDAKRTISDDISQKGYANTDVTDLLKNVEFTVTIQLSDNIRADAGYRSIADEKADLKTLEEIHDWRARLVDYADVYYQAFMAKNQELLDSIVCSELSIVGLSPFVVAKVKYDDLQTDRLVQLAQNDAIAHISVSKKTGTNTSASETTSISQSTTGTGTPFYANWTQTLESIGAYNCVTNGVYTGDGIRIGLLDNYQCNPNSSLFADADIDLTLEEAVGVSNSRINGILHTIWSIAPDAKYYSSGNGEHPFMGLKWLIEEHCDIIHYTAYGHDTAYYEYTHDHDAIIDHMIESYAIVFVGRTGNSGDIPGNYIQATGYAHNAITVGGVALYSSDNSTYMDYHDTACYIDSTNMSSKKPNIAALDWFLLDNNEKTGTEQAASLVTGCLALFLECKQNLVGDPEAVRAIMQATATPTESYEYDVEEGIWHDEKVGAGVINLQNMLDTQAP